jgi:hypothetical protein
VPAKVNKWEIHPITKDSRWKNVRGGLGSLKEEGAHPYAFVDESAGLLDLTAAKKFAAERRSGSGNLDGATAFVEFLREIVSPFSEGPDGRLLTIVLGLEDPWVDQEGNEHKLLTKTLTERRELAGLWFQWPRRTRGVDAIRLNYEGKALNRLAVNVMRREVRHSGHWKPVLDLTPRLDIDRVLIYFSREIVPESGTYYTCGPNGQRLDRLAECRAGEEFPSLDVYTEFGWVLPITGSGAGTQTAAPASVGEFSASDLEAND